MLALFALWFSLQAAPDPAAIAAAMIHDLAARNFAAVEARFDPTMAAAAPEPVLARIWDGMVKANGAFQSAGVPKIAAVAQGNTVTQTEAAFVQHTLILTISVNAKGQVAGFFQKPKPEGPPPAATDVPGWTPAPYVLANAFRQAPVTVGAGPWQLPGLLTLPAGGGRFPAVVLMAGSGPEDADETIGPNKPFRDLAEGLASAGVAVLRYPKRTYFHRDQLASLAGFTVKEEELDDAAAAVALLAARPEIDARRIFVLGHSEGGYLAPRAAANPNVAGVISLAGSTQPLEQSVVMQMRYLASLQPPLATAAQVAEAEADARKIADPGLQPTDTVSLAGARVDGAYFLDLRGYNPAAAAAALGKPVLILQGERDYQVTDTDYQGWQRALNGKPLATFHRYPGLTHLFIAAHTPGPASPADYAVAGHVDAAVVADIAAWVKAH